MKILIIGTIPQDLTKVKGGVQSVIVNLLEGMKSIPGIEVSVFSLNKEIEKPSSLQFSSQIKIFYFPFGRIKSVKLGMLFHGRRQLRQFINQAQPDLIHFQGSGSLLLLSLGLDEKKVIITSHGILGEELKHQKSARPTLNHLLVILIERALLRRFRHIVFISDYSKNYYFQKGLVEKKKAIWRVIYNPVALRFFASPGQSFSPLLARKKTGRAIFVYVGAVIPRKGVDVLIRSFEKARSKGLDFELRIIGGWNSRRYERKLHRIVSRTGLEENISFLGWLDQEGVFAELQKAAVFVLPSFQETLPVSVAEALSLGKIVLASNVGGVSEMITNKENGIMFNRGDISELEGIILDLLEGRVDFASVASNAKKRALQTYHPESVARLTVDFYKALRSHPGAESYI